MAKVRLLLDWISLDKTDPRPLYRQLTDQLRQAIVDGDLAASSSVPSSRVLGQELGISRNTVLSAYEQLIAEGYLEAVEGSATMVADVRLQQESEPNRSKSKGAVRPPSKVSKRLSRLHETNSSTVELPDSVAFAPGWPAFDKFPVKTWARLLATQSQRMHADMAGDVVHRGGYGPLRDALTSYLRSARRVECEPDQVFVVNTARAGLNLTCRLVADHGESCLLEDPGYTAARYVMRAAGLQVASAPVDREGIRIDLGEANAPDARAVYVTPSHQYPMGVSISAARRQALLDWAERRNAFIIEDDYDSEFHFDTRPLDSLQGMDGGRRVCYLGTFGKVLFPSLRVAYVVIPRPYLSEFSKAVLLLGQEPPIHVQAALAAFIENGHFHAHIRRMRRVYQRRQRLFADALQSGLDGHMSVNRPAGGIQFALPLPDHFSAIEISQRAAALGLHVRDVARYCLTDNLTNALFLGYAAVPDAEIEPATALLCRAILDR